jgi:hypothetical protein
LAYGTDEDKFPQVAKERDSEWRLQVLVVSVLALLLYGFTIHPRVFAAGNDAARWALVEAMVDWDTTDIRRSRFGATVDRVILPDGREIPNKPPLLALVAAAFYRLFKLLFGWSLNGPGAAEVVRWTTMFLVALPGACLAGSLVWALQTLGEPSPRRAGLVAVSLAAGTLLWPFSTTLNAHVPAACFVFWAWGAVLRKNPGWAGLFASTGGALDLLPGFGMLPFLGWALYHRFPQRERLRALLQLVGGALGGTALLIASNLRVTGSMLPPKWLPGSRDLSAEVGPSVLGVVLPERWSYPLEILFGGHGLFFVSPILLVVAATWISRLRRAAEGDLRQLWVPLGWALVFQYAVHAVLAGSYGGWSYGFRYLLPILPLSALALAGSLHGRGLQAWLLLLPVSILFAALGAYHPWPPAFEQHSRRHPVAGLVTNPVGGNLAAWLAVSAPQSKLEDWVGSRFISPDPRVRREYYRLFFGSRGDLATMRRFE